MTIKTVNKSGARNVNMVFCKSLTLSEKIQKGQEPLNNLLRNFNELKAEVDSKILFPVDFGLQDTLDNYPASCSELERLRPRC